jgi:TorA maturation chaperone TorD
MKSNDKNILKGYNMLLYFSGSLIMYEPTEECVMDFFSDGILKRLPVSSNNPRFLLAASTLRQTCLDKNVCRDDLIKDFRRLFSFDGNKLAIPRESFFTGPVNEALQKTDVTEFYESYGWSSRPQENIPDDHLGIELLFLTKLIDKYLQLDDEPCCIEMSKEIVRFLERHLLKWVSVWNEKLQEASLSDYYKGVGNLLVACIEDLHGYFKDQGRLL